MSQLYSVHKHIHTGEKPYECEIRKKAFSDNSNLAKHKRFHIGEKQHECGICKKAFALRNVLDKQIHTSEKPHECEMCKKAISSSSSLAKHKQIHTGEKL